MFTLFNLQGALRFEPVWFALKRACSLYRSTFDLSRTFFKFFQISLLCSFFLAALADSFDILPECFPFVKDFFQIFRSFFQNIREPLSRPPRISDCFIPHHQSSHSRHRFCGRQRQRFRRYLHHGKQRSCDPADSFAAPLLLWSSA